MRPLRTRSQAKRNSRLLRCWVPVCSTAAGFTFDFDQPFAFVNGQRQRFLAVNIFAGLHRPHGDQRVPMIDGATNHARQYLCAPAACESRHSPRRRENPSWRLPGDSRRHRKVPRSCQTAWRSSRRPSPVRHSRSGPIEPARWVRADSTDVCGDMAAHSARNQAGSVEAANAPVLCKKRRRDR